MKDSQSNPKQPLEAGGNGPDRLSQLRAHHQVIKEMNEQARELDQIAWMLGGEKSPKTYDFIPDYGDLSDLNQDGLIKTTISRQQLVDIVAEYLELLETSAAVYEVNGDYALGIFSSGWCQLMDGASRQLARTDSNAQALASGKWLCHDSCWQDASLAAIQQDRPVDIECNGGIHLYAVPVHAGGETVGVINFGYGTPPTDEITLAALAEDYQLPIEDLRQQARAYQHRPAFIIDYAKTRCQRAAHRLGEMIEHAQGQQALLETTARLQSILDHSPIPIIEVRPDGTYLQINQAAANLIHGRPEKRVGKNFRDFLPEDIVLRYMEWINNVSTSKTAITVEDHRQLPGGDFFFLSTMFPIFNVEGEVRSIISISQDITDRKQAEEDMRQLKNQLEARVAEQTAQLQERVAELEAYFDATVEREFRMQELREEIARLKQEQDG